MTKATGNRLNWKLTAEGIKKSADDLIATHKKIWDDVGSVKHADASYENVMKVISWFSIAFVMSMTITLVV